MKLRTRLTIALTLLLLAVTLTVGAVAIESTRSVLTVQVDDTLSGVRTRIDNVPGDTRPTSPLERGNDPTQREMAHLVVTPGGIIMTSEQSGFMDSPDPLPDVEEALALTDSGTIGTITSSDGTLRYRAFAVSTSDGYVEIWAAPMAAVDAAVANIVEILLLAGGIVILLGATVTWWTLRSGFKPVDQMVETASAIAGGDLTSRVPELPASTELGRLGIALNEMLAQIEDAFEGEKAAQEQLRQFVADASHELRTPIAAIQGYTELYRQGALAEDEALDNAMRRVGHATARMQRLVADLLLLAKLDQGQEMGMRPVNLVGIVRDAVMDSEAIEPDRPVSVEAPDQVRVLGDDQRLNQVVTNLLANARVHTPEKTPIAVRLRIEGDSAVLDVIDDGPGLPADTDAEKLFDRFYRIDPSRARQTGGSGLGLAIVSAIVTAHGGTVQAANEPDHGARFSVTLPLAG